MPDNRGLEDFQRSEPMPAVGGTTATTGLDYFQRSEPFHFILTAAVVVRPFAYVIWVG